MSFQTLKKYIKIKGGFIMKIEKMNKSNFNKWTKNNSVEWYKASGTSDGFYSQEFFTCETLESDIIIITHYNKPIAYVIKNIESLENNRNLQAKICTVYGLNYIFNGKKELVKTIDRKHVKVVSSDEMKKIDEAKKKHEQLENETKQLNDYLMNEGKKMLGVNETTRKDLQKMIKLFESDNLLNEAYQKLKEHSKKKSELLHEFFISFNYGLFDYHYTVKENN